MRLLASLACRRHRGALVAFVDRREVSPSTPAALLHLDRCGPCRGELESIALTIVALHRLARALDVAAPPAAPTPRLPRRGRLRLPRLALAGPVLATALAGVLFFPAVGLHRHVVPQTDARPAPAPAAHPRQLSAEYLPARGTDSAQFWVYGTYGLTAQVLWPPTGPSRLSLDPESSRFDLRAAGRMPGAWSISVRQVENASAEVDGVPAAEPAMAESI